ncbi:unnamed protein product [Phaeothamnion confervicola]
MRHLARCLDTRERDERLRRFHEGALRRVEAAQEQLVARRATAAERQKRDMAEKEWRRERGAAGRLLLSAMAAGAAMVALRTVGEKVMRAKAKRDGDEALEGAAKHIQKRWRRYYLASFLTANHRKLRPMLRLGRRWLLRARHRHKHSARPIILCMMRDNLMANKIGGALTRFRRCYQQLLRTARAFIACRR